MFEDRREAGELLADKLVGMLKEDNLLVLAIPRGGVVVGREIAKRLGAALDVVIAKKLTPKHHPEFAIGAITHDGTTYFSTNWEDYLDKEGLDEEMDAKKKEVLRRLEQYRADSNYNFQGKTVILVDDGIATGSTVFVILKWLAKRNVKVILAVPVLPYQTFKKMESLVYKLVALMTPVEFSAVGQFYKDFDQTTDGKVMEILKEFGK